MDARHALMGRLKAVDKASVLPEMCIAAAMRSQREASSYRVRAFMLVKIAAMHISFNRNTS
jgi:hypothetical protein